MRRGCFWPFAFLFPEVEDIDFFKTLLAGIETILPNRSARDFVAGFSNGAAMTFPPAAKFPDRNAAVTPTN
jgi:poly(3-hydroxybutyrate) depolymerase